MLKIDAIASRYMQYLRRKSLSQLQQHLFLLAGLKTTNKQRTIQNIINQTIKQNRFQSMLNDTKKEDKQIFQAIFKIGLPEKQQSRDNAKLLKLNQKVLKQIVDLQSFLCQKFAIRYHNQQLFTKKIRTKPQISDNKQDNQFQKIALQTKQIQIYQENGYQIEKATQQTRRQRLYMVNDLQEDNHNSSEVDLKKRQKKAEQNKIQQLLTRLGIQTQTTFPKQNITKRYDYDEVTLKQYLANEDVASFNKFIKNQLSKSLRSAIKMNYQQLHIKKMSEALKIMKILKQSSYAIKQQKQRYDNYNFLKKKLYYSKELVQILQYQQNAYKKIMVIAMSQKFQRKIIILKNIAAAAITQSQTITNKILTFNLFQKLFSLTAAIIQISSSQLAIKQHKAIDQNLPIIKKAWIQITLSIKSKSLVQLADTLYNLNNYANIMDKMIEIDSNTAKSENDQNKYFILFKETIFQVEKMFEQISENFVPISPLILSSIIINCAKLSTRNNYKLKINQYKEGNFNIFKQISNQAKISLLHLISFNIQGQENLPFNKEIIKNLIKSCINMSFNQAIQAIKLAIKYNIDNKNEIIKNLILGNILLNNLNSTQHYKLLQIIDQLPPQESINRYQIQQYIKGQYIKG